MKSENAKSPTPTADALHVHKFKAVPDFKVVLRQKGQIISGYDMLKQRKCQCGKVETYDLERTIV